MLLIHQIPPKPDYLRVKIRRRLHAIGARLLKNSVYLLPHTEEALEDFQWLAREIVADGGQAIVCEAAFVEGVTDPELASLFGAPHGVRPGEAPDPASYVGRTWVTRRGVKIDRMASAWLIRRYIDREARFKFVAPRGYRPRRGEVRFDMYEAEFTHEGAACTFETLLARFGLRDRALQAIGEIVHDIDCKDGKFERPEGPGIALLIEGIAQKYRSDRERLDEAARALDALHGHLRRAR